MKNLKSKSASLVTTVLGASLSLAVLMSSSAQAATTYIWTDGSTDNTWTTVGNWNNGVTVPGAAATDIAVFQTGAGTTTTITDSAATRTLGEIEFNNTTTATLGNYVIGSSANTINFTDSNSASTFNIAALGTVLAGGVANTSETIASNINVTGANGRFGNDLVIDMQGSASAGGANGFSGTLTLSGNITTTAASGDSDIVVQGTSGASNSNTDYNNFIVLSGNITDGAHATVSLWHHNYGILDITGTDTYSGGFSTGQTVGSSDGGSNITEIGVDSVGTVGNIVSSAFGTGAAQIYGGTLSSDGASARTILNPISFFDSTFGAGSTRSFAFGFNGTNGSALGALTFDGAITLVPAFAGETAPVTAFYPFATTTFAGQITGSSAIGGLTKNNPGTMIFSNPTGNNYAGTTVVTGGALLVQNTSGSGTSSGSVTIDSGATLGGNGIIAPSLVTTPGANAVEFLSGSFLNPSATPNVGAEGDLGISVQQFSAPSFNHMTFNLQPGTFLSMDAGSRAVFDLGADTSTSDEVIVTGGKLSLNGQTFTTTPATSSFVINAIPGGNPTPAFGGVGVYTLIDSSSAGITGLLGGTLSGSINSGNNQAMLSISGGDVILTVGRAAGDYNWSGATDSSWATATGGNFVDDSGNVQTSAPDFTSTVNFSANPSQNFSTTLDGSYTIAGLNIGTGGPNDSSAVSIAPGTGGTLTIDGGGINVAAGTGGLTITAPVVVGETQTWANASASNVVISGGVSGLSYNAVNLTVQNTSTGNSTVSGNVAFNGNLILQNNSAATTTVSGGTVNNVGTITNLGTGTGASTISSAIGGNVTGITENSATSSLILSGSNTAYTGTTTVTTGTLVAANSQALGTSTATALQLNGGTLDLQGGVSTPAFNVSLNGNAAMQTDNAASGAGVTYNFGTLTIAHDTLSVGAGGNNTGGGGITFGATTFTVGSNTLSIGSGLTLTLGAVADNGFLSTITGAGNFAQTGIWSGSVGLSDSATGTVTLNQANTYVGTTTVSAGTLVGANAQAFGVAGNTLQMNGGTVDLQGGTSTAAYKLSVGGTSTLKLDNLAPGAGVTYTLPSLAIASKTLTVTAGSNVTSGAANLTISGLTTFVGAPTFTVNNASGSTTALTFGAVAAAANTAIFNGTGTVNQTGVWSGTGGITTSVGTLNLSQANTYTGTTSITGGTVVASNSQALGVASAPLSLTGGILDLQGGDTAAYNTTVVGTTGSFTIKSDRATTGAGDTYDLGTLSIGKQLTLQKGASVSSGTAGLAFGATTFTAAPTFSLASGTSLTLGAITGSTFTATISGGGNFYQTGIWAGTGGLTVNDSGGVVTLNQANTYSGATTLTAGTIMAENAKALGTGSSVAVAVGSALNYDASADAQLAIGGTMSLAGGTGTVLGGSIGSTTTSSEINVAGKITATAGAVKVNVYGESVAPAAGTNSYVLLNSGTTTSNVNAATYTLGTVYDNTNFTVGPTLTASTTQLSASITSATALTNAFWVGGLSGNTNVWAASNGSTASNWAATSGGAVQGLVPGSGATVTISSSSVTTAPTSTVLGANMSIAGLVISDTTNGLGLNADGNTLTIGTGGITVSASVPASFIAANVALGGNQSWTNNSTNAFLVSGVVSGTGNLTIAGAGKVVLSNLNSYTGTTTVSAGSTLVAASAQALGASAVSLGNGATLDLQGTGTANNTTLTGTTATIQADTAISGAGVVSTLGTLAMPAASTLTVSGGSNVTGGTATLSTGAVTAAGAATFSVSNPTAGGTTQLTLASIATTGSNTVTFNGTGNETVTGVLGGSAAPVTMAGSGTLTLSGADTYTGLTTLTSGTIVATNAASLGTNAALTLTSGTLDLQAANTTAYNTSVGGAVNIISDKTAAGAGVTDTFGTLALGSNTLTVSGGSNVTSGTAGVTFGAVTAGNGTFTVNNPTAGGTTLLTIASITPTNSDTLVFNGSGNTTVTGIIGATSSGLTMSGTGTLTLNGNNTYTGVTTLTSGTIIDSQAAVHGLGSGALHLNGGTLDMQGTASTGYITTIGGNTSIVSDNLVSGSGLTYTFGALSIGTDTLSTNFGANVSNSAAGIKFGTTTLTGSPTFSQATGLTLSLTQLNDGANDVVTITGDGTFDETGSWSGGTGTAGVLFDSNFTGTATLSNTISGVLNVTQSGAAGVATLSGATNTFTGTITVNAGILVGASATAFGSSANVIKLNGGTLDLRGTTTAWNTTVAGNASILSDNAALGAGSARTLGTLAIGADTLEVNQGQLVNTTGASLAFGATTFSGAPTFLVDSGVSLSLGAVTNAGNTADFTGLGNVGQTGVWSGTGGVTLDSGFLGTATFSQANTYQGPTTIANGTLANGITNAIGSSSSVTVGASGATWSLGTFSDSVQGLSLQGGAVTGTGSATVTSATTYDMRAGSVSAILAGSNGLTKTTAGTVTLSGANIYTGATTINGGTLIVSGSTASGSAFTVNNGGTLSGTGIVGGSVSVVSGGNINLVDGAPATLTVGSLSTSGGALTFEIGTSVASNDAIAAGTLTIGSGATTITIANLGNAASQTLAEGSYTLLTYTNGTIPTNIGNLVLSTTSLDGESLSLSTNTLGQVILNVGSLSGTTYTLATTASSTLLHAGASTTLTTTLSNTGSGTADSIDYTGVGASASGVGSLSAGTSLNGNLASGSSTSNTSQTFSTTAGTSGTATISSTGSLTQHTLGGTPSGTPTGTSITVYSGFGTWNTNGSGSWGAVAARPTNWTAAGGTPGVTAGFTGVDTATFGAKSAPAITVGLNGAAPNLNAITFSSPDTAYTLAQNVSGGTGTSSITLSGTTPSINVTNPGGSLTAGTQTISAPLILGATTSVNVASSQTLNVSGAVSSSGAFGLSNTGPGTTVLSNLAGNTYSGPTTITGGKFYVNNATGSGTGSGAVTVGIAATGAANSGTLAGKGSITATTLAVNGGGTLASGDPSQVSGTGLVPDVNGHQVGGMTLNNTAATVGSSFGTATLAFDLGSGTSGINNGTASGPFNFSNPNNNSTYLKLTGSTTINFAGSTSIALTDLTNTSGTGSLKLTLGDAYELISAGSNADYLNLVIASGSGASTTYSLSQGGANGYVVGVFTGGGTFTSADLNNAGYVTPISITQFGADGVTPLTGAGVYASPALYLNAGNLEVVPEPGTWALMIGGLALLIVIQRRKSRQG